MWLLKEKRRLEREKRFIIMKLWDEIRRKKRKREERKG